MYLAFGLGWLFKTMIKKINITKVERFTANKDGVPYTYKTDTQFHKAGDPFTRIAIKTEQTGEDVYYANVNPASKKYQNIAEGQALLLDIYTTTGKDGTGEFKNFKFPSQEELVAFATQNA